MRTNAALALALTLLASCGTRRGAATDAAVDARAPTRPSAVAVQLAPTLDSWRIAATLYPGSDPGVGVVLVHQLGSNRGEWAARTASDGRITHLTHRPYPLPPVTLPGS